MISRLCIISLLLFACPAWALVGINQKVFTKLQAAQELAETKQFDQAHQILNQLYQQKLNVHELAQVQNLQANFWVQQKDYGQAMDLFSQVVSADDIPDGLRNNALRVLMQLHMAQNDYQQALDYSEQLMQTLEEVDTALLALRGQCYFQLKQYPAAQQVIEQAIAVEHSRGQPPRENWLLILNAIHHSQEDYSDMVPILDQLLALYPKDRYAYTLAAVYGQLGQRKKQLVLLEPLYEAGYLTEKSQTMLLAQLMMAEGAPVKAAHILNETLGQPYKKSTDQRDLETLAQAWMMAREPKKAIEPLATAAKWSDEGEAYLRLAYAYNSLHDWPGVIKAVNKALDKGQLRNEGNALVLLGMAYYKQQQYNQAIATFNRASGIADVAAISEQWQNFVQGQKDKRELIASQ